MDLLSLDGGERYHTLAALMHIEKPEGEQLALGIDLDERPDRISRVMHEVTHVASLRTTRLGFWIARIAADALGGEQRLPDTAVTVPAQVEVILGAFAPFLEGLALYGQLDYEADNVEEILPFPLNKVATNNTADALKPGGTLAAMRMARAATVWSGTLTALFSSRDHRTEHYFAGYLYIKAVVAKLRRVDRALGEPTTALPLLVRLICDHPIIETAHSRALSAEDVAAGILNTFAGFGDESIKTLAKWLRRTDVHESFDNWDVHGQLRLGHIDRLILHSHSETNSLVEGAADNELLLRLRGATSVHLSSWTAGYPLEPSVFERGESRVRLETSGKVVPVRMLCYSCFDEIRQSLGARCLEQLEKLEDRFHGALARASQQGKRITVGTYITLTRGTTGTALWIEDELVAILPLSLIDNRLDVLELQIAMDGLKLPPLFRVRFAEALQSSGAQAVARSAATDAIMATLVSDPGNRLMLLAGRLPVCLPDQLQSELSDWCGRALGPGEQELSPQLVEMLSTMIDRPGLGGGPFPDLLPNMNSVRQFINERQHAIP